jgi:hypothetical protein
VKDGVTLHLVIRAPKNEGAGASPSASAMQTGESQATGNAPNPAPTNPGGFPFGLGMTPGMGNLNFANANFLDMQQQLQQQVRASLISLEHQRPS